MALKITRFDAGRIGGLLGAFVHLGEEQRLLVDLDQREGRLVLRLRDPDRQAERKKAGRADERSAFHGHFYSPAVSAAVI